MADQADEIKKDPTICDPEELQKIESALGVSIRDAPPEMLKFLVDKSRQAGNDMFKQKRYKEAVRMYSQAIAGSETDHTLFGNRSACYLAMGLYEEAIWDASKCVQLDPGWGKGYYRLGCAYMALSRWEDAAHVFEKGAAREPSNPDMAAKLAESRERAQAELAARQAQAETERRALVFKLRAARREDRKLSALNQFKQSMTAPDWELEDLDWRPTFLPSMKMRPLDPRAVRRDPKKHMLLSYLASLADLAHPKQALAALEDSTRVGGWREGIRSLVHPGQHVLVLGAGGGLLALLAAEAGAGVVTAVERSRSLYRMAKQVTECNAARLEACCGAKRQQGTAGDGIGDEEGGWAALSVGPVRLVDRKLQSVCVKGEDLPPEVRQALEAYGRHKASGAAASRPPAPVTGEASGGSEGPGSGGSGAREGLDRGGRPGMPGMAVVQGGQGLEELQEVASLLPCRASLLVTDLLDYSVLGMGLLPSIDYAARHLLAPGARVLPQKVQVHAVLVEILLGEVSGFDLSPLNSYRWYPHHERLKLSRVPHRVLSAPFTLPALDLQARVDALTRPATSARAAPWGGEGARGATAAETAGGREAGEAGDAWELQEEREVQVLQEGIWNAVAFWFDAHLASPHADAPTPGSGAGNVWGSGDVWGSAPAPAPAGCQAGVVVSSYAAGREGVAAASSWDQAVQYLDPRRVKKGERVKLLVGQDRGQYQFTTVPPQCRPRHALVPRWHFDMVLDTLRNDAYDAAIRRAVAAKREEGVADILALDIGAGSGILSMMAARAGAGSVYGAEISAHMCDVGEEATIMNGFLGRVTMLDRDARRMDTQRKPDGTPPELPRRADLLVYEVFDSGLIGEGVLHLLLAAKHRLLQQGAALVPMSATVYCQPIQMRVEEVGGWDVQQLNRYRWRPDYEGVELAQCRDKWAALAEPVEVFHFDFRDFERNMQPASTQLSLRFTQAGVFNAVAMWFDLHLDQDTSLSTSPYLDKGPTWQQAVQYVEEVRVEAGLRLQLTAQHDTYSISYTLGDNQEGVVEKCATGVPLKDPAWEGAYNSLQELNGQLVKACVQNPLEYRAVAEAAVQFAARPHDLDLDVQQAVDFCVRMMG